MNNVLAVSTKLFKNRIMLLHTGFRKKKMKPQTIYIDRFYWLSVQKKRRKKSVVYNKLNGLFPNFNSLGGHTLT